MSIEILKFVLGPLKNNTYLITEKSSQEAVLVDPASGASELLDSINEQNLSLTQIWVTHAHFDHVAGIREILRLMEFPIPIGLHPEDLNLWKSGAGSKLFGMSFNPGCNPTLYFHDQQILSVGTSKWIVIHTPGHTPGHVSFYNADTNSILCGDVIFRDGIGRTDLPGGDQAVLMKSIFDRLFKYPPHTQLFSGHGEDTTIQHELTYNPFLQ